jgi:hypothetical protein
MSVNKRVEDIFRTNSWSGYYENKHARMSKTPQYRFRPRRPELLSLEGIYPNPSYPDYFIHISCRFNDILRCSDTEHFTSCFAIGGVHKQQPFLRCVSRDWAIAFVVDKHGSFMGRIWIKYNPTTKSWGSTYPESFNLYRAYGNKLREEDVRCILNNSFLNTTGRQILINGGLSDDYIDFE